jgi:dTDP-4-amino-4,6-dideoxygalactose transaminase
MDIYDVTRAFEAELCRYTGAKYAVAVDNQSNALFLALTYVGIKGQSVTIPSHTYPSVPCEILHAGGKVEFTPSERMLTGEYQLGTTTVWDSALRFTASMYREGQYQCLSFTGPYKHLKIGKGGAILTDNHEAYLWFKRTRFSGRRECSYHDDHLDMIGWNFYLLPELAARGLRDMRQFYDMDGNPIHNPDKSLPYPDLSKFPIYTKGNV